MSRCTSEEKKEERRGEGGRGAERDLEKRMTRKGERIFFPFDSFDENDQRAGTMRLMKRKRKEEEKEKRNSICTPASTRLPPIIILLSADENTIYDVSLSLSPRSAFITSLVFFSIGYRTRVKRLRLSYET